MENIKVFNLTNHKIIMNTLTKFFLIFLIHISCLTSFANLYLSEFVTIDSDSGLFRNSKGSFALPCVTYTQPETGKPGYNAYCIQVLQFDLTKLRSDFRRIRQMGIKAIYMRVGTGGFLSRKGKWRKLKEPFEGVSDNDHKKVLKNLEKASKKSIGPFTYTYEVFDYLLDCAEKEGLYVIPMIMDNWSFPRKRDLGENLTALLYENTWNEVIKDWEKILRRYRDRKIIIGYLMEGETHILPTWNEKQWQFLHPKGPKVVLENAPIEGNDPKLKTLFQDFLRNRYKNIDNLKKTWGYGYERSKATYRHKIPFYPYNKKAFSKIKTFNDVSLPTVERSKDKPGPNFTGNFTWWLNIPFDPLWIDFAYFKDWLYTTRMNQLVDSIRKFDPNHLFIRSAALDSVSPWHIFFTPENRGEMKFDVLLHGGGYLSTVRKTPLVFPVHETILELQQTVAPYRPFAQNKIFGMGEGGLGIDYGTPGADSIHFSEVLENYWITSLMMDNYGSGSGMVNLWDWSILVGATVKNPKLHDHLVTTTIHQFSEALEIDSFTHNRNARVLILANGPIRHSMMKAVSQNNIVVLSSILAETHRAFDMATTDEVTLENIPEKLNLKQYDVIFIPQLFTIPGKSLGNRKLENIWKNLYKWLERKSDRRLVMGLTGLRNPYFNPLSQIPADAAKVMGNIKPEDFRIENGKQNWKFMAGKNFSVNLDKTYIQNLKVSKKGKNSPEPFLMNGNNIIGTKRRFQNGSTVYQFGFPLGFSWEYFHDLDISGGRLNNKLNIENLSNFYGDFLTEAGVNPEYEAPPGVLVYISDNAKVIFVRQRFLDGQKENITISSSRLAGKVYSNAIKSVTKITANGKAIGSVTCNLGTNNAAILIINESIK